MSLIGNLEDLSLGDILQIISLSQKSGVLTLSGDIGEGRILFRDGLVCAALVKGGALDLRGVLVDGGFVSDEDYRLASDDSLEKSVDLVEALVARELVPRERIDSLCREAVEQAVYAMFSWHRGDFSFDVRTESEPDDPDFSLEVGINAQYLAMESARLGDETERTPVMGSPCVDEGEEEMSAHEMFGVAAEPECAGDGAEPASDAVAEATEIVALAAVDTLLHQPDPDESEADSLDPTADPMIELVEEAAEAPLESEPALELEPTPEPASEPDFQAGSGSSEGDWEEITEAALEAPPAGTPRIEGFEGDASAGRRLDPAIARLSSPVIAIDPDLPTLEWVKAALTDQISRVHIFQRSELGLARIRQYLVRMESPMLLMSPDSAGDRLSGIADASDFVRRIKQQNPRTQIIWLCDEARPLDSPGTADGIVYRPSEASRRKIESGKQEDTLSSKLLGEILRRLRAASEPAAATVTASSDDFSPDALRRLKEVTAVLNAGASRGEVLPLVIQFASESFSRVAMFMVRDDSIVGMAQSGLERVGGPDDESLQNVRVGRDECAWFRRVFETRASLASGPGDDGDRMLASLLGDRVPSCAYVAPILSGDQLVALLYADNLPGEEPLADTSALEVVLHHAGLALDRAVLERALAEIENESEDMEAEDEASPGAAEGARPEGQSPPSASRNGSADR